MRPWAKLIAAVSDWRLRDAQTELANCPAPDAKRRRLAPQVRVDQSRISKTAQDTVRRTRIGYCNFHCLTEGPGVRLTARRAKSASHLIPPDSIPY